MNFILDRLREETNDLKTIFEALPKLTKLAVKKHVVEQWEHSDLFLWTLHDTLMSKTYTDDPNSLFMQWETDDKNEYHHYIIMHDDKHSYKLNMYVGQGTDISFECIGSHKKSGYSKSVISVNGKKIKNSYGIEFVTDIARQELLFLEHKLKGMQDTEDKKQAEIKEIEGRIKAVDTANALMDIFGLKMDNKSKQKVQSWKDRIEELKGHDENYRKLMAAVHKVQKY